MSAQVELSAAALAADFARILAPFGWTVGATKGADGQARYVVSRQVTVAYNDVRPEALPALAERLVSEGRGK